LKGASISAAQRSVQKKWGSEIANDRETNKDLAGVLHVGLRSVNIVWSIEFIGF
jgi:hypothetical protein